MGIGGGHAPRRVSEQFLAKVAAGIAEVQAAIDARWAQLAARTAPRPVVARPVADGFRMGGGGGDPSGLALP